MSCFRLGRGDRAMESVILDLIQTDQKTREAVEEAHRMKFELKRKIADTEKQLSEEAWKEVHQRVDAKKAELDYQISQVESENLKEYEQELKRLQAHYLKKKEEWKKELVRRCLEI